MPGVGGNLPVWAVVAIELLRIGRSYTKEEVKPSCTLSCPEIPTPVCEAAVCEATVCPQLTTLSCPVEGDTKAETEPVEESYWNTAYFFVGIQITVGFGVQIVTVVGRYGWTVAVGTQGPAPRRRGGGLVA